MYLNRTVVLYHPPTKTTDTKRKEIFNEKLNAVQKRLAKRDIVTIGDNMNAKVGFEKTLLKQLRAIDR